MMRGFIGTSLAILSVPAAAVILIAPGLALLWALTAFVR